MQLFFCLGFLVPLQLEKAQFQSARIVFIGWRPLQPYPLSRLCFQVLLWTRRMSLSEARLYILSPPCCVLVHTTHQMLWSVICVMFWWKRGCCSPPFTSVIYGWWGGGASEYCLVLRRNDFRGGLDIVWASLPRTVEEKLECDGKENWRIKETELQWVVRFKFTVFCSHWMEDLTVFIFFLDICCRLAPFMKMIWGESCIVSKGQVRLDPILKQTKRHTKPEP